MAAARTRILAPGCAERPRRGLLLEPGRPDLGLHRSQLPAAAAAGGAPHRLHHA